MEESVSKKCGGKGGEDHAKPFVLFKIPKECRIKEEIDKQFLEVVVEAIKEFGDGRRRPRTIRVSQGVESGEAATGDDAMPKNRYVQNELKERKEEAFPTQMP